MTLWHWAHDQPFLALYLVSWSYWSNHQFVLSYQTQRRPHWSYSLSESDRAFIYPTILYIYPVWLPLCNSKLCSPYRFYWDIGRCSGQSLWLHIFSILWSGYPWYIRNPLLMLSPGSIFSRRFGQSFAIIVSFIRRQRHPLS